MFTKILACLKRLVTRKRVKRGMIIKGPAGTGRLAISLPAYFSQGDLVTDSQVNEIMRREGRVSGAIGLVSTALNQIPPKENEED